MSPQPDHESPEETAPASDARAEDYTPEPTAEEPPQEDGAASDEPPPTPSQVEPLLGLQEFAALTQMGEPFKAALRRWMTLHQRDPQGHYSREAWQDFFQRTRTHA